MNANVQFNCRINQNENMGIIKAKEKAFLKTSREFVTMFSDLIHDEDAYKSVKPHIERMRNKGMK